MSLRFSNCISLIFKNYHLGVNKAKLRKSKFTSAKTHHDQVIREKALGNIGRHEPEAVLSNSISLPLDQPKETIPTYTDKPKLMMGSFVKQNTLSINDGPEVSLPPV